MYIVGPIVICFSNSKVLLLLLHVILMQISRQCRVDLVLEIGKDELWLFFSYYCGSSRKLWPKCIAKFSFCSAASDAKNNCEKRRRHPPYPISWSYSKIREIGKGRLWEAGGFVSIKMQKALFHFQFHYFLD